MAKNIFKSMRDCFRRKVSEIKEEYESKIDKSHSLCTFTRKEYDRFVKISKENDKFAC